MDSVRFGRSLGFGARSAAKALAGALDAATAPSPTARKAATSEPTVPRPSTSATGTPQAADAVSTAARVAAHAAVHARQTSKGVARGSKRFGVAIWGPLAKLSGVLWLEITGSFFGIFALFAAQAAWTHRADLRGAADHQAHVHALVFLGMAVLFSYFCISSFVRAYRR